MKNYILIIFAGAFILMMVGFYNGYPLVYSDTGTYIYSGFDKFVPPDRPICYGLFLRLFSLGFSLWYVILIQNIITSFLIYEAILAFLLIERKKANYLFLVLVSVLTFFTGVGWYTNQLMPDFFAPVMILSILLLLFSKSLTVPKRILLYIILSFSLMVHLSHLLISILLIGITALVDYILYKKGLIDSYPLGKIIQIVIVVLLSWVILPTIHALYGGGFKLSDSHIFLMAHLADNGLLEKYLKEQGDESMKLYHYRDSIPTDLASFLWDPGSPLNKTGGWENSEEEYKKIIRGTIINPRYLGYNIQMSLLYGLRQLCLIEIGQGLTAYNDGSAPYGQIKWRFPHELNSYRNSKQNKWNGVGLDFKIINVFNLLFFMTTFCITIYIFFLKSKKLIDITDIRLVIFMLTAIVLNSFLTAGLNSPVSRFQARVVWLLPLMIAIVVIRNRDVIKKLITD